MIVTAYLLFFFTLVPANAQSVITCSLVVQITPGTHKTIDCQEMLLSNKSLSSVQVIITEVFISNANSETVRPDVYSLETLEKLRLPNNSLANLSKNTFESVPKLTLLDLSSNKLVNEDIGAFHTLPFLRLLNLSFNGFQSIEGHSFESLSNLEVLDLSYNLLYSVNSLLLDGHKSLRSFYLHNNELSVINLRIPFLRFLDVSYNEINSINTPDLAQSDLSHNKIRNVSLGDIEINISYNNLKEFEILSEDTRYVCARNNQIESVKSTFFAQAKHTEYLDLSNNAITYIENQALSTLNELKLLNLSHNKLSDFKHRVFDALDSLEILDISYNQFVYLYDIPFSSPFNPDILSKLNKITVNNNQWSCNFLQKLTKAAFLVIGAHTTCKSDVSDFEIEFDKVVPIETDIPVLPDVNEEEIAKTVKKYFEDNFLNRTVMGYVRNLTEAILFNSSKDAAKATETVALNKTVWEYIENLSQLRRSLNAPHEVLNTNDSTKKLELFMYILLLNTITTALLLLVIIVALYVMQRKKSYNVKDLEERYR